MKMVEEKLEFEMRLMYIVMVKAIADGHCS